MYMLVSLIWFTKLIQSCPSLLSSTLLFKSGQSCDLLSVKLYWSAMPYQELKSRYFGFSQQRNYIVEALDSIPGFISRLASCNDKVITPGKSAIISTYELLLSVIIVNTIKKTLHLVQRQPFPYFSVEFVLPRVNLQLRLFVRFRRHVVVWVVTVPPTAIDARLCQRFSLRRKEKETSLNQTFQETSCHFLTRLWDEQPLFFDWLSLSFPIVE